MERTPTNVRGCEGVTASASKLDRSYVSKYLGKPFEPYQGKRKEHEQKPTKK